MGNLRHVMKKVTVSGLLKKKQAGEKITSLTAYDASFAKMFDEQGIDALLIPKIQPPHNKQRNEDDKNTIRITTHEPKSRRKDLQKNEQKKQKKITSCQDL